MNRFDPAKDAINQEKHGLPLRFGDRIFEDVEHLIIPSIREIDGEERFKVVGAVDGKPPSLCGGTTCRATCQ